MLFPLAKYGPDVADVNSAFTDDLSNVLSSQAGYIPAPDFEPLTAALPSAPLGWISVKSLDNSIRFFAGTATDLYILNNSTYAWTRISQVAGGYHATRETPWSIRAFGNYVIAVNPGDPPQVYNIGVDTAFRNLGGNPPIASYVAIWGDFVALMGLPGNPNRVQWSGLNNAEFWTPGSQNSDYQDFPDGGKVQGSSETTNPLIFLESAIQLATFVPGSVQIFTFQKVHDKRGAASPSSIASRGALTFYADTGGFFQIGADASLVPIGFERVDRTVFKALAQSSISRIQGAVDPFYSRVYWAVDYNGSGVYDTILVYDWQLSEWTVINANIVGLFSLVSTGYTLEALDLVSPSLDALPFSLDSKAWQGGAPVLGAFSDDFRLGSFTGMNLEAVVTSQEVGSTNGDMTRTKSTNPIIDCQNVYVSLGVRNRRSGSEASFWLDEQRRSANTGLVHKNSRARFHRIKVRVPYGELWSFFSGIDVDTQPAGKR